MSKHTPGPWYLINSEGTDFTAISTKPQIERDLDIDSEVLGSSEWLRVKPEDLRLIAAAPEMYEALKMSLTRTIGWEEKRDKALAKAEGHDK